MSAKVQLQRRVVKSRYASPSGHKEYAVASSLPFFQSAFGSYVHRIRYGTVYVRNGRYSHTGFTMWCGQSGFLEHSHRKSNLMAQAPENAVFCATCEGRAIGAGLNESHILNGRMVRFSPR